MFCDACGKQIDDNSRFCTYCGNNFDKNSAESTEPMRKSCPQCQSECDSEDYFCGNCGYTFGFKPIPREKTEKSILRKQNKKVTICRVVAILAHVYNIVLAGYYVVINIIQYDNAPEVNTKNIVWNLCIIIPYLIMIFGLIKCKKNPAPGIGYGLFVFIALLLTSIFKSTIGIPTAIVWCADIMTAMLFFVKSKITQKLWYVPTVLMFISLCVALSMNIYNIIQYVEYLNEVLIFKVDADQYIIDSVIPTLFDFIPLATGVFFSGYTAKKLWLSDEETADVVEQELVNID